MILLNPRYIVNLGVIIFILSLFYLSFQNPFTYKQFKNAFKGNRVYIKATGDSKTVFFKSIPFGYKGFIQGDTIYSFKDIYVDVCKRGYSLATMFLNNDGKNREVCITRQDLTDDYKTYDDGLVYKLDSHPSELDFIYNMKDFHTTKS